MTIDKAQTIRVGEEGVKLVQTAFLNGTLMDMSSRTAKVTMTKDDGTVKINNVSMTTKTVFTAAGNTDRSSPNTITDLGASFPPGFYRGYVIKISAGTGINQEREIIGNTDTVIEIADSWDILPDSTSIYQLWTSAEYILTTNDTDAEGLYFWKVKFEKSGETRITQNNKLRINE